MTTASVVIPTRGGAHRLPQLLAALAEQTHEATEVVVVVDGEVDDSAGVLDGWANRLDLRVVVLPENRGRSSALNTGFTAATGEVLIRCDDDLVPRAEHVARHVAHHVDGGPVGVIGLCPNVFPDTPYARAYGKSRDALFRQQAFSMTPDQRWRLWGANVSVTRETWEAIGPYDTAYRAYGLEDVDWGYRLQLAGIPLVLDPELDAPHHGAATTAVSRATRAFHSGAAQVNFDRIHGEGVIASSGGGPQGLWGRGVHRWGKRADLPTIQRTAHLGDVAARWLPRPVAEKVIAFTVESAAVAGRAHPNAVVTSI